MSPVELIVDGSQVTERALAFPDRARALRVVDDSTYAQAAEFLKGIKALRDEIAETFDPHIKRAHEAHKALLQEKQAAEAPLAQAERVVKDTLVAYEREQERQREEMRRRLEAQARTEEEERRLNEALALDATGDEALKAEAEALLEAPLTVAPVAMAPATPKVAGISYRETWSARVTNLHALVKLVAGNPQFIGLVQANAAALNAQARSLKSQLRIAGVEAVCTRDVAAGRR